LTLKHFVTLVLALIWFGSPLAALETKARAALVLDYNTGTVLLEKNADTPIPPASMSKLMTINMVFEALQDGRLTLDEKLPVSQHAMSYKGSTMFLTTRDRVSVNDLIQGVIVVSGNDACVVLAEALAGSEKEFARLMTERAKQLGMTNSTFANSNGWPDPGQRMSARDLVTLATRLIRVFPQYYHYFGEKEFAFDNRAPDNRHNRNPLLKLGIGADGLKTGHTTEAGYGLVGSAAKNGRRIVVMVSGLESDQDRGSEAEKLINWGFRQFAEKKVLEAGKSVGSLNVWLGTEKTIAVEPARDVTALLPVTVQGKVKGEIRAIEPVPAPITKGQVLGNLVIKIPDMPDIDVPLIAAQDVETKGFLSHFVVAAQQVLGLALDVIR